MKHPVVIIGMGELGGEFACGFLRGGYPVVPVLRGMAMAEVAVPEPVLVLIAVAENDLQRVLEQLPMAWRDHIVLVQNELTPRDWQCHGLKNVTVAVVWFEKKPGKPLTDILFTPVFGPKAGVVIKTLNRVGVTTHLLASGEELIFELARKSLYILTLNIAALKIPVSAGEIWRHHNELACQVAGEVLQVLELRFGRPLPRQLLIEAMAAGIEDYPNRPARGRRAVERLERVLAEARDADLVLPVLEGIGADI